MFERLTDEARQVLVLAQEQSRDLGHDWLGTEHLLLGLVARREGVAADLLAEAGLDLTTLRGTVLTSIGGASTIDGSGILGSDGEAALRSLGIDMDFVRSRIDEMFGRGALERPIPPRRRGHPLLGRRRRRCSHPPTGPHLPLAARAKKSLELALREALRLRHRSIGPEHILLGILRVDDCLAAQILVTRGIDVDELRERVVARLGQVA